MSEPESVNIGSTVMLHPVSWEPEKLPFHCQNNERLNTAGYHKEKVRKIDPILIHWSHSQRGLLRHYSPDHSHNVCVCACVCACVCLCVCVHACMCACLCVYATCVCTCKFVHDRIWSVHVYASAVVYKSSHYVMQQVKHPNYPHCEHFMSIEAKRRYVKDTLKALG